ncbi:MAG TPA: hypothetical protein VMY39_02555 [Planctomycetota bacterium]|nr:hypothetical protein [Planctomycetota bacterium]
MKRFVWVTTIVFGGGIAALMVASMILQRQAEQQPGGVHSDLRTTMRNVRHALENWQETSLGEQTSATFGLWLSLTEWDHKVPLRDPVLPPEVAYSRIFDAVEQGDVHKVRKYRSLLSALETFPSVKFPGMTPEQVDVNYEVSDGSLTGWLVSSFRAGEGGYFLKEFALETHLPAESGEGDVFHEGTFTPAFEPLIEKLLTSLVSGKPEDLREVMTFAPGTSDDEVRRRIDVLRAQISQEVERRLKKMLPVTGPLVRGTQRFAFRVRGTVPGETGDRKLQLDMSVSGKEPLRLLDFNVRLLTETAKP